MLVTHSPQRGVFSSACLALLIATGVASADYTAWSHRLSMVFSPGTAGGTLTNFPALVKLSADITGFDYAQFADPGAADLRFVNRADGAELVYEVEQWNPAGTSFIWVRIPALSQGTIVDAYWGNAFVSTPAYVGDGSVWQSSYLGVWHLHDDLYDSTAAGNDATRKPRIDIPTATTNRPTWMRACVAPLQRSASPCA
ncbi:MAG: DUF2341 domain-containing protein [Kiritimatiellae bacterium]|nr:DUF2341 domain-containing protein [Kiritimatiellia bacterium]